MKVYLAADHAGFELKNRVKEYLKVETTCEVEDCGALHFEPEDDYPDFIAEAARRVSAAPHDSRAIIFGGSGQGEAMLANRFRNVRAAVYYHHDLSIIELSRQHNDANVLSIGARFVDFPDTIKAIERWLITKPSLDPKYARRVKKAEHKSASQ